MLSISRKVTQVVSDKTHSLVPRYDVYHYITVVIIIGHCMDQTFVPNLAWAFLNAAFPLNSAVVL